MMYRLCRNLFAGGMAAGLILGFVLLFALLPGCEKPNVAESNLSTDPLYIGLFQAASPIWRWSPADADPVPLKVLDGIQEVHDILPLYFYTSGGDLTPGQGFRIYAVNMNLGKLFVIFGGDADSNAPVLQGTADIPCQATSLTASRTLFRIFVGCLEGIVLKIHPDTLKIEDQIQLPDYGFLTQVLAVNSEIYATNNSSPGKAGVSVINGDTMKLVVALDVGKSPQRMAYANGELLVTNRGSNSVSVINLTDRSLITEIPGIVDPGGIAESSGKAYITSVPNSSNDPTALYVVDVVGRAIEQKISKPSPGLNPWSIAASQGDGALRITVGNMFGSTLTYRDAPFAETDPVNLKIIGGQPGIVRYADFLTVP